MMEDRTWGDVNGERSKVKGRKRETVTLLPVEKKVEILSLKPSPSHSLLPPHIIIIKR